MDSPATQKTVLNLHQTSPAAAASTKGVPLRSAAISQSSQSFRTWLALAQQRTMLGLSSWDDAQGSSLSSFGSHSLPLSVYASQGSGLSALGLQGTDLSTLGLRGAGLSALGLQSSSLSTLGLSSGLGAAACPLCGASVSPQALLSGAMIQVVEAVAREAAMEALRETMMYGIPLAGSGSVNPLDATNGLRVIPATPSATETPAIGISGAAKTVVANPASSPSTATGVDPAAPASSVSGLLTGKAPMTLADFPKPPGDNGRGMHWIPTTFSSPDVVDRFVREAKEMHIKWMVFLNDGTKIGDNDYLVKKLVENGIMPVMRVYTDGGKPIEGDLGALVRHYKALGVDYYQLYNEPNLNVENPEGTPNVDRYLDKWVKAARVVTEAGGLPGFGALSPGGNFDDLEFLKQALDRLKERGETDVLDHAWLAVHNYTLNHPLDYNKDSNGFLKFKWYDQVVQEKLGRSLPIISTEGGTYVGSAEDHTMPPISEDQQVKMVVDAYRYMKNREPYNFAYTYWIIANEEGGGADRSFSHQALFKPNQVSPLVQALKNLGD